MSPPSRMSVPESGLGFHAANGFHFRREKDGDVTITLVKARPAAPEGQEKEITVETRLTAAEWASVQASVSAGGSTSLIHSVFMALQGAK